MVVRELVALLGIKYDKKTADKAEKGMDKLKVVAMAAAAAFVALGAIKWAKGIVTEVAKAGDALDKMAHRTGIAFRTLQDFSHAAELSGASLTDVEMSIKRLQASQADAAFGLQTYTREFDRLGVTIKDEEGKFKDTTQLLLEVADGMQGLETDTERTAVAVKLLGRSGTTLIPLLKQGSGAIREMMGEVEALGGVMDKDLREASVLFIDNQQRIAMVTQGVKFAIGSVLLPVINRGVNAFLKWWKINGKIIRQDVGKFFKRVASIFGNLSRLFGKITGWAFKFWKNLDPLSKNIVKVTVAVAALVAILKLGVFGKWLLIIGLIVLALEDFNVFLEGGDSALGRLLKKVENLTGIDFAKWIRDAVDALSAFAADPEPFDWGLYFKEIAGVVSEHLTAAGETWNGWINDLLASESMIGKWYGFWLKFYQNILKSVGAIADFLINVWDGPREAWDAFVEHIKEIWSPIVTWFENNIIDPLVKVFGKVSGFFGGGKKPAPPAVGGARTVAGGAGAGGPAGGPRTVGPVTTSSSIFNQQKTNVQVDIKATPGMSEERLGKAAASEIDKVLDKRNRSAMQALAPQKAVGV
jgi:hypothetical protein